MNWNWLKPFTKEVIVEKVIEKTVWPDRYHMVEVTETATIEVLVRYLKECTAKGTGLIISIHDKDYWIKISKV